MWPAQHTTVTASSPAWTSWSARGVAACLARCSSRPQSRCCTPRRRPVYSPGTRGQGTQAGSRVPTHTGGRSTSAKNIRAATDTRSIRGAAHCVSSVPKQQRAKGAAHCRRTWPPRTCQTPFEPMPTPPLRSKACGMMVGRALCSPSPRYPATWRSFG